MTATPATTGHTTTPPAGAAPSRWSAWSDRLNPILVREVRQAIKGRMFTVALFVALVLVVTIATHAAGRPAGSGTAGRDAFHAALATLIPLIAFVVPMQAYHSMRLELRGGIAEQLLLSRLRPTRILLGKLQAAMVQFVLYAAVIAPLLATSYLLRGVDVPTIAVSALFALLLCTTATSFAISSAAQAMLPALQPLANLATAFGLGMATFGLTIGVLEGEYSTGVGWLLRGPNVVATLVALLLVVLASCSLSLLIARGYLLHAFENRATPFRLWLFAVPLAAWGWLLAFVERRYVAEAGNWLTFGVVLLGIVFGDFMLTEQRELSPRVRAHVPRGRVAALLAAPFLPGRDRGMACFTLFAAAALVLVAVLPAGTVLDPKKITLLTIAYGFVYLAIGRWIRGRLPETVAGNNAARFLLPVVVFAFVLLPLLVDVFVRGGVGQWHVGHLMNPFWTIDEFVLGRSSDVQAAPVAWITIGTVVALHLPAMVRGVREVLAASAARPPARAGEA